MSIRMEPPVGGDSNIASSVPAGSSRPSTRPRSANTSPTSDRSRERQLVSCNVLNSTEVGGISISENDRFSSQEKAAARILQTTLVSVPPGNPVRDEPYTLESKADELGEAYRTTKKIGDFGALSLANYSSGIRGMSCSVVLEDSSHGGASLRQNRIAELQHGKEVLRNGNCVVLEPGSEYHKVQDNLKSSGDSASYVWDDTLASSFGASGNLIQRSSSCSCSSNWAEMPRDVMSRVHHLTDIRSRRRIR